MTAQKIDQSFEENLLLLVGYVKQVFTFSLWMTPLIGILGALGAFYYYKQEKKVVKAHVAELSFVQAASLNLSEVSSGSEGLSAILRNGGGRGDFESKLNEIIKSEIILTRALYMPTVDDSSKLLINQFLEVYYKDSADRIKFSTTQLEVINEVDFMTAEQVILFKSILRRLKHPESSLLQVEEGAIVSLLSTSEDEALSVGIVNNVYRAVSGFYDEKVTTFYADNLKRFQRKTDSLRQVSRILQTQLAKQYDVSGLDIKPSNSLVKQRVERDFQRVEAEFAAIKTNLETDKLRAEIVEPNFKILNRPIRPLDIVEGDLKGAAIRGGIIGLIGGLMLTLLIFILKKLWPYIKKA